tara:strand:- start:313 stop:456 length:144 start_codon:yes stop_codon:yes gene_type:complete
VPPPPGHTIKLPFGRVTSYETGIVGTIVVTGAAFLAGHRLWRWHRKI